MNERDLEKNFEKLKHEIPVNQDLKRNLRKSFFAKRKPGLFKKLIAVAAAAAVISFALIVPGNDSIEKVSAASLNVSNHISFIDIGNVNGLGVSEYNGTLYVPVAGQGLFIYDRAGFRKLYGKEITSVRVSPDGTRLVFSENGAVKIYELESGKVTELLKPEDDSTYYDSPSWAGNDNILCTKIIIQPNDTHGFTIKESSITKINLKTMDSSKLADGSNPSYVEGSQAIVFDRDGKILYKNLNDNSEKFVDTGISPSVSPDGTYIAYVKVETTSREVAENAQVEESVANIWIVDAADFLAKKQITSNYPYYFTNAEEWAKGLTKSDIPQVLSINGAYTYYSPVWSSDSRSIYAIKDLNLEGDYSSKWRIMKIDLDINRISAEDTVKRYLQALVVRDDDYARSLMKSPPEILTISNPRQVGYRIISSGKENGRDYVDAEVYWSYMANAYYQIVKSRYYLVPVNNGYIIDNIQDMETTEVFERDGIVYLSQVESNKKVLFKVTDIPSEFVQLENYRLSSLAYYPESGSLIFTIQGMKPDGPDSAVKVLNFSLSDKKFKVMDELIIKNSSDTGASNLTIAPGGKYAALDLFSRVDDGYKNHTYVYDISDMKKLELESLFTNTIIDSIGTGFWDTNNLVFSVTSGEQSIKFTYDPKKTELKSY